jgi:uncharacterized protein (TIGR03437 family)
VVVTNVDTGDTVTGPDFRYLVKTFAPSLSLSSPAQGDVFTTPGLTVSLFGTSLSRVTKVTFGSRAANYTVISDSQINAVVPDDLMPAPACPAGTSDGTEAVLTQTGCTATLSQGFSYQRKCVAPTPVPGP